MSVEHPQPKPEYMTPSEVAGLLRVDTSTLRRWAKTGVIGKSGKPGLMPAFVTPGGHSRYLVSDVYTYLNGRTESNIQPDHEVTAEHDEEEN